MTYTNTLQDEELLPTQSELETYLTEVKSAHLYDIMRYFFDIQPMLLSESEDFFTFSEILQKHLQTMIDKRVLVRKGKFYQLFKDKTNPIKVFFPSEDDVISTLKTLKNPINAIELSILHFDGCDLLKLENLCNNLVDRGILAKFDHDNFCLVKN